MIKCNDNKAKKLKWAIFTLAEVEISSNAATLIIGSIRLFMKVNNSVADTMKPRNTAPLNDYCAANPRTVIVGFEGEIPAKIKQSVELLLIPEKQLNEAGFFYKKIANW